MTYKLCHLNIYMILRLLSSKLYLILIDILDILSFFRKNIVWNH